VAHDESDAQKVLAALLNKTNFYAKMLMVMAARGEGDWVDVAAENMAAGAALAMFLGGP
jgi:hypothetical protein